MPTPSTFYYDSTVFCDATDIWNDSALSTPSANGWYQVGGVYSQKLSNVLGPCQACPECGPSFINCDGPVYANASEGVYSVNYNVGSSVGAVIIKFAPLTIPDRLTWTHDGLSASEYSSRAYGYKQGYIGNEAAGGSFSPPMINGSPAGPYSGSAYEWNDSITDFISIGSATIPVAPASEVSLTAGGVYAPGVNDAFMVVPKTDPSVGVLEIRVDAPDSITEWHATAYCPKSLNPFPYNPSSAGSCTSLSKVMYTCSVEPGGDGTNTMLGLNDWAFENYTGETPVSAGVYPVEDGDGVTKCVTVDANGTITNITTGPCTTNC